ncbi:MAG: hypothetical protein JNJ57_11645, partial [Saprospiraceae bacterium]|nr:hypothetical protein [Saprospiraceae bacterium]
MERFTSLAKAHGTPLLIFSPQAIIRQYRKLQTALPQVKHHYALKALPYEGCVQAITSCGGYFDVASIGEMEIIKQNAPEKLSTSIYTHPIKTKQDIESALEYGIQTMVADNMEEL